MGKETKAVILAGGKGTRLYPITYEIPKPLLPVKRKPILNHLVDLFLKYEVRDIQILVNRGFEEEFRWWKKRYYPRKKISFFRETKPLGTLGGLWYLREWIGDSDFFLTNGDELKKVNLQKMQEFHQNAPGVATIGLVKVPRPQDYGVVVTRKARVVDFLEKPENPPTNYISSGLYLLSPGVFDYHPGPKFSMIEKDIFPRLAREGKLAGFKFSGKWTDCGTWERYSEAVKEWR